MGLSYYGCLHTFRCFYRQPFIYWLGISLKFLARGLYALILTILFQSTLVAQYLYKDEVLSNIEFRDEINTLGAELYEKTGIALKMVMIKKLPKGMSIVAYEKEIMKDFAEPTILLSFSELDTQVDILANDSSLYKYFDKRQVLSPVSSPVQAFIISVISARSFDSFIEGLSNYGGTILPILSLRNKESESDLGKYSAGMYNGYTDIAEQIADYKGVELEHAAGNTNKDTLFIVKILFYSIVLYAIYMYIRKKLYLRRQAHEHE